MQYKNLFVMMFLEGMGVLGCDDGGTNTMTLAEVPEDHAH